MQALQNIKIVLAEPSHPGNIGAVARSMKTMGLTNLVLINPKKFPHPEATKRAASADSVLEAATVLSDINQAVSDCTLVLGTSVRDREVAWPTADPKQTADKVIAHLADVSSAACTTDKKVAILFGRESSGLTNQEMDLCQMQIRIPANDDYSSLNLASAVQIIAYELRMQALSTFEQPTDPEQKVTPAQQRQAFANKGQTDGHLEHLQATLAQLDFIKHDQPTMLMRKLTRLYNKAQLTIEEIQILRGILTAIQTQLPGSELPNTTKN